MEFLAVLGAYAAGPGVAASLADVGAVAASTAATGALVGGLGLQAAGMYQQGQAASAQAQGQQAMSNYNAQVAEQEAKATEARAGYESRQQAEQANRYASSMQAAIGASGTVSTAGTPLLIQAKQAAQSELENLMIGYSGQVGADRARSQATLDRLQGGIYGQQAKNARLAGTVGAGSSLLQGFGQFATTRY